MSFRFLDSNKIDFPAEVDYLFVKRLHEDTCCNKNDIHKVSSAPDSLYEILSNVVLEFSATLVITANRYLQEKETLR